MGLLHKLRLLLCALLGRGLRVGLALRLLFNGLLCPQHLSDLLGERLRLRRLRLLLGLLSLVTCCLRRLLLLLLLLQLLELLQLVLLLQTLHFLATLFLATALLLALALNLFPALLQQTLPELPGLVSAPQLLDHDRRRLLLLVQLLGAVSTETGLDLHRCCAELLETLALNVSHDARLDLHADLVQLALALLLEHGLESLAQKHLCLAVLPILAGGVISLQNGLAALGWVRGHCTRGMKNLVAEGKVGKRLAHGISSAANADSLKHTRIPELIHDDSVVKGVGDLCHVGLDAPNEEWIGRAQCRHQLRQRLLELRADGHLLCGAGLATLVARHEMLKQIVHKVRLGLLQQLDEIVAESVAILLEEAFGFVENLSGIVLDAKVGLCETGLGVEGLLLVLAVDLGQEGVVGTLGELALLVEKREKTKFRLDEIEALLVVDPLDVGPVDVLLCVLGLFNRKDVLIEVLLELLVGVVDAHLLKAVLLEVLKSENVEHSDREECLLCADDLVDAGNNPLEELHVQLHSEGIARVDSLRDIEG
eukprot:Opistho-2@89969